VVTVRSTLSHAETLARLLADIDARRLTLFAHIDHARRARDAGLGLPDEDLLLFGDPRAGTPLMQGDPVAGLELPLRMLVWTVPDATMIGYDDPRELAGRYRLAGRERILDDMAELLGQLAAEAAGGRAADAQP
jgi:uncharacterized protein (DUF302 family)